MDTELRHADLRSAVPRAQSTTGRASPRSWNWLGHSASPGMITRNPPCCHPAKPRDARRLAKPVPPPWQCRAQCWVSRLRQAAQLDPRPALGVPAPPSSPCSAAQMGSVDPQRRSNGAHSSIANLNHADHLRLGWSHGSGGCSRPPSGAVDEPSTRARAVDNPAAVAAISGARRSHQSGHRRQPSRTRRAGGYRGDGRLRSARNCACC